MALPDFKKEKNLSRKGYTIVIGIDEAGRGPLAGPVTAAAVALGSAKFRIQKSEIRNLRDSKKLTSKRREEFYEILTHHPRIKWAAASVGPKEIDRIDIAKATNLAGKRAFKKLISKIKSAKVPQRPLWNFSRGNSRNRSKIFVLLDGSLFFKSEFPRETIVKGDEKIWSIAAASVIAKVTRDRKMRRLAKKFPAYGLEIHKGYGTRLHYQKLKKCGPSEIHRKSFL